MFKNHSLPTSYSQGTVEVLSKSTEADDVELVSNRNGVEETAIYDNLIGQNISLCTETHSFRVSFYRIFLRS